MYRVPPTQTCTENGWGRSYSCARSILHSTSKMSQSLSCRTESHRRSAMANERLPLQLQFTVQGAKKGRHLVMSLCVSGIDHHRATNVEYSGSILSATPYFSAKLLLPPQVLPLTTENVLRVFETGVLMMKGGSSLKFGEWLDIPEKYLGNPRSAAVWWVTKGRDRRWRVVIYILDKIGETRIADELMPFSEPPLGV